MPTSADQAKGPEAMAHPDAAIAQRVQARLRELAEIGADPRGGISRLAYSEAEREAHARFAGWVAESGKRCTVDAAGNSVAVFAEGEPYFLIGSHLDTVVNGGAYDGAAGVVGALEAATLLGDQLRHGVRVVAFAGEEGARFGRPNLGSALAAGLMGAEDLTRLRDADGTTLQDAATKCGLAPDQLEPWLGPSVRCFFETHIEQGRQLEGGAARLGLVDAIAGSVRLRFEIQGRPDHSGATPMRMRADALAAASELVLDAERIGRGYRSTVATVGRIQVLPNNVTTVPGEATLWVDIRDIDADMQRLAATRLFERAREIGEQRQVGVSGEVISDQPPVVLEAWPRVLAHAECDARGLPYRVLSSGAGHDAAIVARRAPAAMLFIPCTGGISHSPRENASSDDVALAAEVASAVIRKADALGQ
jgi:allantoate deiminase